MTVNSLRIDKPFHTADGLRIENFTRVETFGDHAPQGDNDVQWLKAYVDPNSREVFSYQPQIVPANRTTVPARSFRFRRAILNRQSSIPTVSERTQSSDSHLAQH